MNNKRIEDENQKYLSTIVEPIFKRLTSDVLRNKPKDTLDYLLDWFKSERRGEHIKTSHPKIEKYHRFLDILDKYSMNNI